MRVLILSSKKLVKLEYYLLNISKIEVIKNIYLLKVML
jgi:hypothetical protein